MFFDKLQSSDHVRREALAKFPVQGIVGKVVSRPAAAIYGDDNGSA